MEFIQCKIQDGVGTLTIHRPESLNALNSQVIQELDQALHELDADEAVKVVVLTGSGDKAFVAGGDIKEMLTLDVPTARTFSRNGQRLVLYLETMKKPVLASVNGYALGGGLELALGCDFIFAAERARFGLPEVTLGVLPGFGGTQNLARRIGSARARELIFTGRTLTAREALDWGLVNAIFPDSTLSTRTMEMASRIAHNGSLAVASAKQALVKGQTLAREAGFHLENELFAGLFSTSDQKEGLLAFVEKRQPEFKGH